jgi:hypothetical protein
MLSESQKDGLTIDAVYPDKVILNNGTVMFFEHLAHIMRQLDRDTLRLTGYTGLPVEVLANACRTVASHMEVMVNSVAVLAMVRERKLFRTWEQLTDGETFDILHSENPPTMIQAHRLLWRVTSGGWECKDRSELSGKEILDCQ